MMFRIIDKEKDSQEFIGTTSECAEFIGMNLKTFYYYRDIGITEIQDRWIIEELPKVTVSDLDAAAIRKWNEFTEPLRKKFGIPVYRG